MGEADRIPGREIRQRALGALTKAVAFFASSWLVIVALLLLAGFMFAYSYWNWDYWSELNYDQAHKLKEIRLDRPKIIQQLLLVVGGIAAFILAAWRTWTAHRQANAALDQVRVALRQADSAERVHNIDRYTRAVNMLDSDKTAVRQAGVYALLEIA